MLLFVKRKVTNRMSKCRITLPSMTFAQKARKTLTANQIEATAEKLSPAESEGGCGWCVEVDCARLDEALRVLDISDVPWKKVLKAKL